MFELWESRDYAGAGELVDPDVVFTRVGSELGHLAGEWRGLSSAWAAMVDFMRAWKDLHTLPERFFDLPDDRVLACAKQIGRGRGSSVVVEHDVAFLFTLRDARSRAGRLLGPGRGDARRGPTRRTAAVGGDTLR